LLDYIQEIGRAGRGEKQAHYVTLVRKSNFQQRPETDAEDSNNESKKGTRELATVIDQPGCLRQKCVCGQRQAHYFQLLRLRS